MATDPLDDLLTRSVPPTPAHLSADQLRSMSKAARTQADTGVDTVRRRRHRLHWGIVAGITGALLVGGGAAVAGGLINWEPEYQNPDTAFTFSLPSGRACEVRVVVDEAWGGPGDDQAAAQQSLDALRTWMHDTDIQSHLDMDAARASVAQRAKDSTTTTGVIGPDGWLADVSQSPNTQTADDRAAIAVDQAVRTLIAEHMDKDGPREMWAAHGGVKCEPADR